MFEATRYASLITTKMRERFFRKRFCGGLIFVRQAHLIHQMYTKQQNRSMPNLPVKQIADIELVPCKLLGKEGGRETSIVTLEELLPLIQPLHYLQAKLPDHATKIKSEDAPLYRYEIKKLPRLTLKKSEIKHKRAGGCKQIHITTGLHPLSFKHKLILACTRLEEGSRVEFHLRPKSNQKRLSVDWALQNLPYLRPDVIFRSMPKGTVVLVPPIVNEEAREIIWAFSNQDSDKIHMRQSRNLASQWTKGSPKYQKVIRKLEFLQRKSLAQGKDQQSEDYTHLASDHGEENR